MTNEQLNELKETIKDTIQEKVNGKVEGLRVRLEEHIDQHEQDMDELRPYIQGATGIKIIRDFTVWIGGLAIAYVAIRNTFNQ